MEPDWGKLHLDLMAMKNVLEFFRREAMDVGSLDVENLLAAARECNVELIALRSALELARSRRDPANKR